MRNNALWEPARAALDETVSVQASIPGSTFAVIPFGDKPYDSIAFGADEYATHKRQVFKVFDTYITQAIHTRVSDVLTKGFAAVDPNKENKIYLLTDGEPNGGDTPAKVAALIDRWCASHRNTRLFYVALKEGVVNRVIADAIDRCADAYVVQCRNGVIPQIADIASDIHASTEELGAVHNLRFSIPLDIPLTAICPDPLFTAEVVDGKAHDGVIHIRLNARDGLSDADLHSRMKAECPDGAPYTFEINVTSPDRRYIVANPEVSVYMTDHIQSRLNFGDGIESEIVAPGCRWHDSFWWSEAAQPATADFNLNPSWVNVTDGCLTLAAVAADGQSRDFLLLVNGHECPEGTTFDIHPGEPCQLHVEFAPGATTGKRYIRLEARRSAGIDIIEGQPASDFSAITLRTEYTVDWNPLKTAAMWLGIIVTAALVLWLAMFKQMVFPTIKVNRVELRGPGTYYLPPKRIKGARMAVLTARKRKQSLISRIFTGRIIYIAAPHFSPDIEILPAGRSKRVKLRTGGAGGWSAVPSGIIDAFQSATISREKDKFTIDIS